MSAGHFGDEKKIQEIGANALTLRAYSKQQTPMKHGNINFPCVFVPFVVEKVLDFNDTKAEKTINHETHERVRKEGSRPGGLTKIGFTGFKSGGAPVRGIIPGRLLF